MRSETVSILLDLNRQFYQQFGAAFSATRQRIQPGVARLLERLPLQGRWLDLGCGNGELARELGKRGFKGEYVGLDFSDELLREAGMAFQAGGEPHPPAPSPWNGEGEENPENMNDSSRKPKFNTPKVPVGLWNKLLLVAREMRQEPTEAESVLWQHLRGRQELNCKFRRQHRIDRFIVDFYCAEIGLVMEVDGSIHQYTQEEDALRQEFLESLGLKVIRFQNDQVLNDINQVLRKINQITSKISGHNSQSVSYFPFPLHLKESSPGAEIPNLVSGSLSIPDSPPPLHGMERGPGGEVLHQFQPEFHLVDLSNPDWSTAFPSAAFDVVLSFAALHHLPGQALRMQVLGQVRRLLRPGGLLIHSEWQFQNSPKLLARLQPWGKIGLGESELEEGDALLDWRYALPGQPGAIGLRYVHRFSLEELAGLAESCGFQVVESFESDGRGGRLGLYQIWQTGDFLS